MEFSFSKATSIHGDYRDRKSPLNWESLLFAEVLFMDKTHLGVPMLYQLNGKTVLFQDGSAMWKENHTFLSQEAFVFLGEVAAIDKKKKQILLTNNNTVSYHYLIIASGPKPMISFNDEELVGGLQALIDAVRVKPKIPHSFAILCQTPINALPHKSSIAQTTYENRFAKNGIGKIAHPYISSFMRQPFASDFSTINKRLYEVQL